MKRNKKKFFIDLYAILGITIFLFLWAILSALIHEPKLIFPSPIDTFKEFFTLIGQKYTYLCIGQSLLKTCIGFLCSLILGCIFGIFGGIFNKFHKTILPIITSLKAIPTVSFLFLFFVISGYENAPIFVVIFITFPSLYDSVVGGIRNISKSIIAATRLDSSSLFKRIHKVYFPLAFNYIAVGITASFGLALKVEIMSEVISGSSSHGIGNAIRIAKSTDVMMAPIFAWTLISVILLLCITYLLKIIKSRLIKKD